MQRRFGALACVLLMGAVVASTGGVAAAARSAQKASYTVMAINPSPGFGLDWTLGQRGFWDRVDAAGGVGGHQINFTTCSDGTFILQSQDLSATCAQNAVSGHVLAVVGSSSNYNNVIYPVLSAAHIADIGSFPASPIDNTSLESTPFLTPIIVLVAGLAVELKQAAHCKKIAILDAANTAITKQTDDAFAVAGKWAGAKVAPAIDVPVTQTDYSPTIAVLDGEGVDCIAQDVATGTTALGPILTAIADSGKPMKVDFVGVGITSEQLHALGSAVNGLYADVAGEQDALVNLVNPVKTTPQERQMIADFNRASPTAAPNGNLDMPGWVAADATDMVLKQLVATKTAITPANVQKVLRNITLNTGVMPTINFSKPGPVPKFNRIHNTDVNWIKVVNYQEQPLDFALHPVGPSLAAYHG